MPTANPRTCAEEEPLMRVRFLAIVAGLLLLVNQRAVVASQTLAAGDFKGCPAAGQGGDPDLSNLKNRSSQVDRAQPMTVSKVLTELPTPTAVEKKNRAE
jgi:hypothetical protein